MCLHGYTYINMVLNKIKSEGILFVTKILNYMMSFCYSCTNGAKQIWLKKYFIIELGKGFLYVNKGYLVWYTT